MDIQDGDEEDNKSSSSGEKIVIVSSGRGRGRGRRGGRTGGGAIMTKQDAAKTLMSMGPYMVSYFVVLTYKTPSE
jgi:hypothetical protein